MFPWKPPNFVILPATHNQGFPRSCRILIMWPWPRPFKWSSWTIVFTPGMLILCRHIQAYTLGRLSIDGFSLERVAQCNLEWIFSKLDSGFQSLVGFRILKPRIPDSRSKKFRDSGVRIPLHGAKSWLSTIYIGKPAGSRFGKMVRTFQDWQIASWNRVYHFYNYKSVPIIEKRPRKPEMQYQRYGFEEMEHEFSSV